MSKFEYPFKFYEKKFKKGSPDSKFENRIPTAVSGTEPVHTNIDDELQLLPKDNKLTPGQVIYKEKNRTTNTGQKIQ